MLTRKPDDDGIDALADMVGTCKVCGSEVHAKRHQCRRGDLDLLYSECKACKARSPSKAGGAVEMNREKQGPRRSA